MAITSEIIGSLNTPGFGFLVNSPSTYALPKFPDGAAIMATRWGGSSELSYDILDRETGEVVSEGRTASYAHVKNLQTDVIRSAIAKGALFRCNNSTSMYVFIIPNTEQAPPVWNGQ